MWQKNVRYLDYNASSGITGSVRKKLTDFLSRNDLQFANPSSTHRPGQQSAQLFETASLKIARSLGKNIESNQLIFTASGTESNQTVIRSALKTSEQVIIGAGEHSASYDLLELNKDNSTKITELPLLSNGQYDLEFLKKLLIDLKQNGCKKVFLSLFWANNETGVLTDLQALSTVIRDSSLAVSLHLDGAQVWGKLELDLTSTPAHYITFSSHKIGAPAGVGVIWVRPGSTLLPLIVGEQSRGLRGGTENLIGLSALSFAAEEILPTQFQKITSSLREELEEGLKNISPEIKIWGEETNRISNTTRISFLGFQQYENWVERLDLAGFAISHGSACKSRVVEPSRVLMKMGAKTHEAINAIRVSFGPEHEPHDVSQFLVAIRVILSEKSKRS